MTVSVDDINLSDLALWEAPLAVRDDVFRRLRANEPIAYFPELTQSELVPAGPGYWALTKHAHVVEASRRADLFCSGQGTNITDMPVPFLEFFGSMINMDDPRHVRMRRIVSQGFTARRLDAAKADVEATAKEIVDDLIDKGTCDFVTEVAALLPLRVIVDMMGIPRSEEKFIFDRTNTILGFTDSEYVPQTGNMEVDVQTAVAALFSAGQELSGMVQELGADRQKNPRDDLMTALVTAEVDGEHLSPEELGSFFILLVAAGNETTRNAIAHGLHALTEHPEQAAAWTSDFDAVAPTAVEEIVRWASPVAHFRRTVTQDGVRLGDLEFSEGDKVVLWYLSANRDEDVFEDPYAFDVRRSPNDHLGFGGPGPHFCLGAHLARREVTVMFKELLTRVPDIHSVGEPDRLRSNFINGIKHLQCEFTPGG